MIWNWWQQPTRINAIQSNRITSVMIWCVCYDVQPRIEIWWNYSRIAFIVGSTTDLIAPAVKSTLGISDWLKCVFEDMIGNKFAESLYCSFELSSWVIGFILSRPSSHHPTSLSIIASECMGFIVPYRSIQLVMACLTRLLPLLLQLFHTNFQSNNRIYTLWLSFF